MKKVVSVIVTYEPDAAMLGRLLDSLCPQVAGVVVVDNGSTADVGGMLAEMGHDDVTLLELGWNQGVAAAQNHGLTWALQQGSDAVLLMDQDSVPAPDMVSRLLAAWQDCLQRGVGVAALGPRYVDERLSRNTPFIRSEGRRLVRVACDGPEKVVAVDYVISSGCLLPREAIETVGLMRDELFIDYVDVEWGLRAAGSGLLSFGVCDARMTHRLGDDPIHFMGRSVAARSPRRHYYFCRNALLLYRQAGIPLNWKLLDAWRLLVKYVFYSLLTRDRLAHFRMMSLGLWHGAMGRGGPLRVRR
ncbi:hypothetical protein CKO35_04045 [Ectothiorhodospira shaposhnikovii]|uniref:glycosyltransferase family 2 protein n=1 Tax=Ectothiorhodospira shaposhnikovii TaxID=1054 RepID=UPI001902C4C7|nr:glycosyltransferase family 2 protein [Ectothiorhodospira shaposhnikovii]MBK1672480.1 hypothetical protein [Ectothiorhodospira shaposhnikovii]